MKSTVFQMPGIILRALRRFRWSLRLARALEGLGKTLACSSLLLGAALALDRWFILTPAWRIAVTGVTAAAAALLLGLKVFAPLLRPLPALRLARTLERTLPSLEEGLITLQELQADRDPDPNRSPELVEALAQLTAARLRGLRMRSLIDAAPARRAVVLGLGTLFLISAIALFNRESFTQLFRRFLHPREDLPRPSTVLLEAAPGNLALGTGDDLAITVKVVRGRAGSAKIYWRTLGEEWNSTTLLEAEPPSGVQPEARPAAQTGDGGRTFKHTFRGLQRSLEYQVAAGDAATPVYRAEVLGRPATVEFQLTYRFPEYTRRPDLAATSSRGEISAVAGSTVRLSVRASVPLAQAAIRVDGEDLEPRPLAVEGDRVRGEIAVRRSTLYQLYLADSNGISNRWGEPYSIRAEKDSPPAIRLLEPQGSEVLAEEGRLLGLKMEARDDFGVESLVLACRLPRVEPLAFPIPWEEGSRQAATVLYRWDIASLGLVAGESCAFWISARDGLGQEARTGEVALRIAFLPDPPEGPQWLARLRELEEELDRSVTDWKQVLNLSGDGSTETYVIDPARAEHLQMIGSEVLRHLAHWRQIGELTASLGGSIPVPSIHRDGLKSFAWQLGQLAGAEGMQCWRALADTAESIQKAAAALKAEKEKNGAVLRGDPPLAGKSAPVSEEALRGAFAGVSSRLAILRDHFTTVHRAERLEEAFDRLRMLEQLELDMVERRREKQHGFEDAASLRMQQALRLEATALGGELLKISKLGGQPDRQLEIVALVFLDSAVPRLEKIQKTLAGSGPADPPLAEQFQSAARTFADQGKNLVQELDRYEAAAVAAWEELQPDLQVARRLEGLAAEEKLALESLKQRRGATDLPAMRKLVEELAARGRSLDEKARGVLRDLQAEAEEAAQVRPPDFESAADLGQLRDLLESAVAELAEAAESLEIIRLQVRSADASLPREAFGAEVKKVEALYEKLQGALEGLGKAYLGLAPAARLGLSARRLDGIAVAQEGAAWKLRGLEPSHRRALFALARAEREAGKLAGRVEKDLRRQAEAWEPGRGRDEIGKLPFPELHAGIREVRRAAEDGKPREALESALLAAQKATEAALLLDQLHSSGLPGLEEAREWIQSQLGSLSERVFQLAEKQRRHAKKVEGAAAASEAAIGSLEEEEEGLRQEAGRLSRAVSLEGNRLAAAPPTPRALAMVKDLGRAAEQILAIAQGAMLEASQALEAAARAQSGPPLDRLLQDAAKFEAKAAEGLEAVAQMLRLLEEHQALELTEEEFKDLLAPAEEEDPDSPEAIARCREQAKAWLKAALRARQQLAARLPESAVKDRILESLQLAAQKFQEAEAEAEAAARAGSGGGRARDLLLEGKGHMDAAAALVGKRRGEKGEQLAAARRQADEKRQDQDGKKEEVPMSKEMEEVYAELRRLLELRGWQVEIEAKLDELLKEPDSERDSEKLAELAKLEEELASVFGQYLLTTHELVQLVADLLGAIRETRALAEAHGQLSREAQEAAGRQVSGAGKRLAETEQRLIGEAEAAVKKLRAAGSKLTFNLPRVIKPYWEAEAHTDPVLLAMQKARETLNEEKLVSAGQEIHRAAVELSTLQQLLEVARNQALEEIASRESESSSMDLNSAGMERTLQSLKQASREIAKGNLKAAKAMQKSAARGMTAGMQSLQSYLEKLRQEPGKEGQLLSQVLEHDAARRAGLSWDIRIRSSERDPHELEEGQEARAAQISEWFPEEYRELVRIYLKALAGER